MSLDITPRLRDNNTIFKNHSKWTHLVCIFFRSALGFYIISNPQFNEKLLLLFIAIILIFSIKLLTTSTWKGYMKTVYAYTAAYRFATMGLKDYAGLIIIFEAMLSIQSRHIITLIK